MVFPAMILSTVTTRQSTSAMAGCLPTAPLHVDVGHGDDRSWWTGYRIVFCRSNSSRFQSIRNGKDGTGHAQDPHCTQQRENGLDGQQWWWTMESFIKQRDRCHRHIIHQQQEIKEQMVWRPTLALLPVWRWTVSRSLLSAWLNQTAEDLGRLINWLTDP